MISLHVSTSNFPIIYVCIQDDDSLIEERVQERREEEGGEGRGEAPLQESTTIAY